MNPIVKKTGTVIYYLTGISIIGYIVFTIGINNIYHSLITANINYVATALIITVGTSVLRIYKIGLLLNRHIFSEVFDLFIFSRVGKELSFAGYFLPMAKKNNRNLDTVKNLLVDRYTEISSTILIGFISLLFILTYNSLYLVLLATLGGTLLLILVLPFVNTTKLHSYFKNRYVTKFINLIYSLQNQVNIFKSNIPKIYFISILATALDFFTAYILLKALNIDINPLIIPVVWSVSGLMSILGFMIIGTTEVSVIYLYDKLANINTAVTISFVFISRLINILALVILLLINIIIIAINKLTMPRTKAVP